MYRTIITSAAVAVAALAIVAGAAAATTSPTRCARVIPNPYIAPKACTTVKQTQRPHKAAASSTTPVACKYAMPTSRAQAIACSSRDVNAPLSPAVLAGIKRAHAASHGQPLSPDVRQEIYDANQKIAAAVPAVASKSLPLSEKARNAIYDANHRESESVPTTAFDGLDPAIATAIAAKERASYDPASSMRARHTAAVAASSVSSDPGFNWGSAGIGAVAGAVLLIAAMGSGALMRRRRQPLHA